MSFDESRMPCRVMFNKYENGDEEVIFVFKDEETAEKYQESFPWPWFEWICWDTHKDAFLSRNRTIH